MPLSPLQQKLHLLHRAGFGPKLSDLKDLELSTAQQIWPQMLAMAKQANNLQATESDSQMSDSIKEKVNKNRQGVMQLNQLFFEQMLHSDNQLLEKMSFFWHGHFACRVLQSKASEQLINIIRKNALGNFGQLLLEVSQSSAMIRFLNNQQNKKSKPNENFARELMELFTLGRGNYTETDIKESARAFTGWGFNPDESFKFNPKQHDDLPKNFLGKTGSFGGEDIINIILEKKECAYFITKKIYAFFVNQQIDEARVKQLADKFYKANYDISVLMNEIFGSQWFYDSQHFGNRIKSPIELMVGLLRLCPAEISDYKVMIQAQKSLGQMLFFPPNVAGWPSGKAWIDSNSIMLRLQLPSLLMTNKNLEISPKADDDIQMGQGKKEDQHKVFFVLNSEQIRQSSAQKMSFDELKKVLVLSPNHLQKSLLPYFEKQISDPLLQKMLCLMSCPEYQLS